MPVIRWLGWLRGVGHVTEPAQTKASRKANLVRIGNRSLPIATGGSKRFRQIASVKRLARRTQFLMIERTMKYQLLENLTPEYIQRLKERFLAKVSLTEGVDALQYLAEHGSKYDAIHASPPCQAYSVTYALPGVGEYPELVEPIRNLLLATGKPYIIENVPGAPLQNPLLLCGSMFGLSLVRHRLFECCPPVWFPPGPCQCKHLYTASHRGYSAFKNGATAITVAGNNYPLVDGLKAMGIDWMSIRSELSEAIPPAYTEFIGRHIMQYVLEAATT